MNFANGPYSKEKFCCVGWRGGYVVCFGLQRKRVREAENYAEIFFTISLFKLREISTVKSVKSILVI